jgi:adenosine deaminase
MDYENAPKVELHVHLDCSLSYEVVQLLEPSVTIEEYVQSFIAPPKCPDLADYITRAIKGFELMQTEQLRLVTWIFSSNLDPIMFICRDKICPLLHTMHI